MTLAYTCNVQNTSNDEIDKEKTTGQRFMLCLQHV